MKQLWIFCAGLIVLASSVSAEAAPQYATIGTGGVTGVYYPVGGAISKMVNEKRKEYNIRTTVEATGGSIFNVNALMTGDIEFGIVQSDLQYQAHRGLNDWSGKPQKKLRAVFALHPEIITIVAASDKGIKSVTDLKGAIVNIGQPGSGQRSNAMDLFTVAGIDVAKDLKAEGLKPAESAGMLQDGRIDAYFYTVGHPNGSVKEAAAGTRKVNFVEVPEKITVELIKQHPFYAPALIPIKHYPGVQNDSDTPSYGVKATLCTNADVPDNVVYAITKEVFENLESFRTLHPALEVLTKENMLEGLSAPLHPGAEKYYKEVGLL